MDCLADTAADTCVSGTYICERAIIASAELFSDMECVQEMPVVVGVY